VNTRAVRTVLVLGATGFIGSYVSRALRRAGFDVVQGVRSKGRASGCRSVEIDYRRDDHAEHWLPALRGIDAVVNAVGILRESSGLTFDAVHVKAPVALFEACVQAGVEKIIQISALGLRCLRRCRSSRCRAVAINKCSRFTSTILPTPWPMTWSDVRRPW